MGDSVAGDQNRTEIKGHDGLFPKTKQQKKVT